MGYYSNQAIDCDLYDYDCSYTPPEKQLLWRLEELQDRLEELSQKPSACGYRAYFSEDDLRYILPEHFKSTADVAAAIALAVSDLSERYGIRVYEETAKEKPVVDEITGMQVTFFDILAMQPPYIPLSAA